MNVDECRFLQFSLHHIEILPPRGSFWIFLGKILGENPEHTPVGASPMHAFPGALDYKARCRSTKHKAVPSNANQKAREGCGHFLWYYIASTIFYISISFYILLWKACRAFRCLSIWFWFECRLRQRFYYRPTTSYNIYTVAAKISQQTARIGTCGT